MINIGRLCIRLFRSGEFIEDFIKEFAIIQFHSKNEVGLWQWDGPRRFDDIFEIKHHVSFKDTEKLVEGEFHDGQRGIHIKLFPFFASDKFFDNGDVDFADGFSDFADIGGNRPIHCWFGRENIQ